MPERDRRPSLIRGVRSGRILCRFAISIPRSEPYCRPSVSDFLYPVEPDSLSDSLRSFPAKVRRRGEDYFKRGAVQRIEVHEPGTHYCVYVQGTELYEVDAFHEDGDWCAACTCPYGDDCKHAYAALYSLREIANGKLKVSRDKAAAKKTSAATPSALRKAFELAKGKRASKREVAYLK